MALINPTMWKVEKKGTKTNFVDFVKKKDKVKEQWSEILIL